MVLVLLVVLIFGGWGDYWSATWSCPWFFLILGIGDVLVVEACREISLWCWPLAVYALAQTAYHGFMPGISEDGVTEIGRYAVWEHAVQGYLIVICCTWGIAYLKKLPYRKAALQILWFVIGLTILLQGFNAPNNGHWFGNPSMEAGLMAALWPLVGGLAPWAFTLVACLLTKASIPLGVLAVSTTAMLGVSGFYLGAAGLGFGGFYYGQKALLDNNGRFEIWSMAWQWWQEHSSLLFGQGYGTGSFWFPIEQQITQHFHGDYFLWIHGDWLQLLIEGGVVGAALTCLAVGALTLQARHSKSLLASWLAFCGLAVFNYPLHSAIHVFSLMLLVSLIASGDRPKRPTRSQAQLQEEAVEVVPQAHPVDLVVAGDLRTEFRNRRVDIRPTRKRHRDHAL